MRDGRRMEERAAVRLERPQLVWLTLGGVVAMGLCFALGVLVGKRAARLAAPPPSDIAQVDANVQLQKELTFYDKLTAPGHEVAVAAKPPARVEPAPAPARAAPPAPAPAPAVAVAASAPATTSTPAPARQPQPPAESAAAAAARVAAQAAAGVEKPQPARAAPAEGADAETVAELNRGPAHRGDYTVQVSSFQTAAEADAYAASLTRKGYKPFVVAGAVKGKGTWYRVRVGAFRDAERARSAKVLLARADIPAWIVKTE